MFDIPILSPGGEMRRPLHATLAIGVSGRDAHNPGEQIGSGGLHEGDVTMPSRVPVRAMGTGAA